jgi:uncharacterized LabA/DUF88 family protein
MPKLTKSKDNLEILQNLPQPVGVFVDAGNVFFTQKTIGWNIDWLKFRQLFEPSSDLFYFTAFDPGNQGQIKQNAFLANNGFTLFTKPIHTIKGNHKGNLDVELTWEVAQRLNKYSTIVLFSGDGDFEYMLSSIKNSHQKQVIVIGSSRNSNYKLMQNFQFIPLESIQKTIQRRIKTKKIPPVRGSSLVNQP